MAGDSQAKHETGASVSRYMFINFFNHEAAGGVVLGIATLAALVDQQFALARTSIPTSRTARVRSISAAFW